MPVPAAVERVRESAGPDATIAHAPGSVELLGETCAATGGMLLATALPASVAVALEPNDSGELTVISAKTGEETSLPMPDSVPEAYPAEVTAVAAAIVALQHTMHLIPRTDSGITVRWASNIPGGRGLGEIAALQSAVALAANARWGDRDDVPTRARLAAALHEASAAHYGAHWPLHPYTAALRSRPDSVLTCNHSDEAVTQTPRPDNLALMVAYSPDITGASPQVERHEFFAEACSAFGVPTLHGLPEAQPRVLEWVRARREVNPDDDAPTVGRATQWLDDASGCSDRARAVSAHLRHGDAAAAMAGVAHDVSVRDTAPSCDSPLGRLVEALDGFDAVARCCPARGAAVVVWAHADDADDVEAALRRGGSVMRIEGTDAGDAVDSPFQG
ncbi:galactokinase family protein [Corynebacterium hansenii]|uniref:Galactokinase family protein n=1 Tax=Corynebacterium hansenii TaxID=394964 RepID=A0ABV7ZRH1_9CORY|nr:galactokinase family protein [Corynebacterium hansenii]WJZ00444.1 galactokinase [Corynebacterium hansenii]